MTDEQLQKLWRELVPIRCVAGAEISALFVFGGYVKNRTCDTLLGCVGENMVIVGFPRNIFGIIAGSNFSAGGVLFYIHIYRGMGNLLGSARWRAITLSPYN